MAYVMCVFLYIPDINVISWLNTLSRRLTLFSSYLLVDTAQHPPPLSRSLSAYIKPERFLQMYLQTHVRKQFRDLQNFSLHYEVFKNLLQGITHCFFLIFKLSESYHYAYSTKELFSRFLW